MLHANTIATHLSPTHRALVLEASSKGFEVKTVPTPEPTPGSVVVRILAAGVLSYHREIYNGTRPYGFPKPLVGGASAIGRVAATGPDATVIKPGQLVFVDCVIRARDDPGALFLSAIHEGGSEGSKKLMRDLWRDGNFAGYARMPLENCIPLNEERLCQELGYTPGALMYLSYLLVPYGGLRDIDVQPGDTVAVFPATGGFGGAGVQVAISMSADVIAVGRNEKELARIKEYVSKGNSYASVQTVKITGDEAGDTEAFQKLAPIDAFLDLTPPAAAASRHLHSALPALKYEGRISLMGFVNFSVSEWKVIAENITLKGVNLSFTGLCSIPLTDKAGKLMYKRDEMLQFVKLLEKGKLPKGKDLVDVRSYSLKEWREAFDVAAEHTGLGKLVVLVP